MQNKTEQSVRFAPFMTVVFLGAFGCIISISMINVALSGLVEQFHTSLDTIQWLVTGFALATGSAAPVAGYLGDRFGYKRVYLLAVVGFALFSAGCAITGSIPWLITLRVLQGACSGLVMPLSMALIYRNIPKSKQAFALSIWSVAIMMGPALGPTLSGWILQQANWRWLFLVVIPSSVVTVLLGAVLMKNDQVQAKQPLDIFGLLTIVVASTSLLIAFGEGHAWGWTSPIVLLLLLAGTLLLVLFVRRELTVTNPLLELRIFQNTQFSLSVFIASLISMNLYAGNYLTPLFMFMQDVQHVSPLDVGLTLLPAAAIMILLTPLVGKTFERLGTRWFVVIGMILIVLGTLRMGALSVNTTRGYIIAWMSIRNIGISLAMTPVTAAGMSVIPKILSGRASSISNWSRQLISAFCLGCFTSVLGIQTKTHEVVFMKTSGQISPVAAKIGGFTLGINDVYTLAAFISMLGLIAAFWIGKGKKLPQR